PNIYDVLIAFFGGLVGVIAVTRVEKGNPIPGVAIATALMPPLCTAGYGIATFNAAYFAGAFYLYTINCFFICIATFFVVKYLKYPAASFKSKRYTRQIRVGITALIFIMIIPSFYLAYTLWNEKKYTKTVEQFINTEFVSNGNMVIYKKVDYNSNPKKVELALLNRKLSEKEIENYNRVLANMGAINTRLTFRQNDEDLKSEILNEINKKETVLSEKDIAINNLRSELSKYKLDDPTLTKELAILFPAIIKVSLGKIEQYPNTDSVQMQSILLYSASQNIEEAKLKAWLAERLKTKNIVLLKQ